jgi:flagellar basal-body rod protein FlgB
MLDKLFGGDTFVASTRALDAYALRHQAISNNLANISTPGYKRQIVRFEDQLSGALAAKGSPAAELKSVSGIQPTISTLSNTSERADGNNIDPETETMDIAINELHFNTMAQQVTGYFNGLKLVINGK